MMSEIREALRSIGRDRGATALAVSLLAVTMGTTTAVYAVIDAVMVRPLPFVDPHRLVVVWQRDPARNTPVVEIARGEVDQWRRHAGAFDGLGVFGSVNWSLTVRDGDARARLAYASVSAGFFSVLGTPPQLGRVFDASDEATAEPRTVVISHRLWTERFGQRPDVVGQTLRVQEGVQSLVRTLEIIGVMPSDFDFPRGAMAWLPAAPGLRALAARDGADANWYLTRLRVYYAVGRLRGHVTPRQSEEELGTIIRSPEGERDVGTPSGAVVTAIDDFVLGPAQPVLSIMLAGATLMLVLACSVVASLHVFRAARQDRALAIQVALGATRGRLTRRAFLESTCLAIGGTLGAAGVAWMVTRGLVLGAPLDVPRLSATHLGALPVLLVMAMLTALVSVLCGLWPAIFVRQLDASRTLTSGARSGLHPRARTLQRGVIGSQVALAVLLLAAASLFVRSVHRLDRTELGFNPDGLLSMTIEPSAPDADRWDLFYEALVERAERLASVRGAGAVYLRPLSGPIGNDGIPVLWAQAGLGPDAPWRRNPRANLEAVTPGYFRALGSRLLAGRPFTAEDRTAAANVVMVSASAAARYWPGRDPLGERLLVGTQRTPGTLEEPRWGTVVGVVEDIRYRGLTDPRLDVYLPAAQSTARVKHLMVSTTGDPEPVVAAIRTIARELDPAVYLGETVRMDEVVARETAPWRFAMRVLSTFGVFAAVLAAVGLVGMVSLAVALRRRELGVRAALGATPARLCRHVLADAACTSVVGVAVGLAGAVVLGRSAGGLLVETVPHDPGSLAAAAALTLVAGLVACLLPAKRASAEPVALLRE